MAPPEFLREFEFLPNLPKSNLDDRTFNDLVQECKLRIPRYCQEWTNHNPSDPGITLIELFAWLVDQMLLRFNQVPRLHYVAFLELLGIRLQPPTAAETELTFYLTKPVVAGEGQPIHIAKGTEVATLRTETEPAVVFTTYNDLVIGQPTLQGLFTAHKDSEKFPDNLEPISSTGINWENMGQIRLFQTSAPDNCFYILLAPDTNATENSSYDSALPNTQETISNGNSRYRPANTENDQPLGNSILGNVIALNVRGVIAGSTGIDPTDPPLIWEAWVDKNERQVGRIGHDADVDSDLVWQSGILLHQQDDKTRGFSFHELQEAGANPENDGADIILHLPQNCQQVEIGNIRGYLIRCVYRPKSESQGRYTYSPIINRLRVRSIGGTTNARECVTVRNEFLGISNGKPGQTFQLEGFPILDRDPESEFIFVKPPEEEVEIEPTAEVNSMLGQKWQEVDDFSDSDVDELTEDEDDKRHYTLDARTGTVQFGPLIREPSRLQLQTLERTRLQPWGKEIQKYSTRMEPARNGLIASDDSEEVQRREWQYGKIPPRGAEIYMSVYRTGGGSRGNVQAHTLTVLKTAIPYVKLVTNHQPAEGGTDAESLDEAVLRVPRMLRNAKSAVIPEDFETVALDAHNAVHRAHCLPCTTPGIVQLLVIPNSTGWKKIADIDMRTAFPHGLHPEQAFALTPSVRDRLMEELNERKPLGVQVQLESANFVGVKVYAEIIRPTKYQSPRLADEIRERIHATLYDFLNPLTGGFSGKGWELGRPLSVSDVIALLQDLPEVQLVSNVQLLGVRYNARQQQWFMNEFPDTILDPGSRGVICSWNEHALNADASFDSQHQIRFIE